MDLETVANELYGIPPDEFVALRTERVKQARSEGDRPLAKEIGQLARPTRSAWLVNVLAREAADELGSLLDLGAALSDAQRRLSGSDLRRLSSQRHAAVEALVRRAVELGTEREHTATEATRLEVSQTLQAALADPATGRLVQTGRAIKSVTYGGFGPMEFLTAVPPLPPEEEAPEEEAPEEEASPKKSSGKKSTAKQATAKKDQERKRALAQDALTEATEELGQLREAQKSAESELKQSVKTADELTDLVSSLRDQLEEAKNSERAARESVRFARKQVQQLKEATGDAETAVRQAREKATALD